MRSASLKRGYGAEPPVGCGSRAPESFEAFAHLKNPGCVRAGIESKVKAVVHDGASNMRETGRANKWMDVSCSAHKLHLTVTGAMGVDKVSNSTISKCVGAASRLVGHFSHSPLATTELEKRQQQMGVVGENGQPLRLVQYVKTRWNSVHDMLQRLVKLRWPVVAVLFDRAIVKQQDAKTLEMRDEHWSLMSDLLPVLQPLQIVTELLCAEKNTSASVVYPLMYKLVNVDMAESDDDAATVRDFKRDIRKALDDRFALSSSDTARHPFVIATVLDPATKDCDLFPTAVRVAAYEHVRGLVDATASADDQTPVDNDQEETSPPPAKRAKADPRTASLKFLQASTSAASPSRAQLQEFDRYLAAPADDRARDALQWWSANAQLYPATARIAREYLSVPATSAQSERQFSAAGRLISKLRSRLDPDRVDTIIFLYENL